MPAVVLTKAGRRACLPAGRDPDGNINTTKIFTNKDLEKVYGWDKEKGAIYVVGKNGDYLEQVNSKILSTASDFVVYKNSIYVLQGSKIYKIE